MIKMKFLTITFLSVAAMNLHAETVIQQMGRAQDTIAEVEFARFQQEQADRAAKIAEDIRQVALAIQAAKEARERDLDQEIRRCLFAGLPAPTEASWRKPTAAEQENAEFKATMWDLMNARVAHEYSNPQVSALPTEK